MKMSDAISQMVENASFVLASIRRDVEAGRLVGADAAKAMAQVVKAQAIILKAVESQRQVWKAKQRRYRAKKQSDSRIL